MTSGTFASKILHSLGPIGPQTLDSPELIDTILIPPGAQYGAILGKAEKGNRLIYAVFARLSKPLQRMNYHS